VNRLQHNYRNPFNPSTTIAFSLAARGRVSLVIYDALGARVRSLLDDVRDAGVSSVGWDGRGDEGTEAASGVYFCRMVAGSFNETRRLVLVR